MLTYSSNCFIPFICILYADKLMKWWTTSSLLYDSSTLISTLRNKYKCHSNSKGLNFNPTYTLDGQTWTETNDMFWMIFLLHLISSWGPEFGYLLQIHIRFNVKIKLKLKRNCKIVGLWSRCQSVFILFLIW